MNKKLLFSLVFSLFFLGFVVFNPYDSSHNTVNLITPTNNSWVSSTNNTQQFEFNRTSSLTGTTNCTLVIDGLNSSYQDNCLSDTNYLLKHNTTLAEGNRTWFVNATNGTTPNDKEKSGEFVLYVDRTTPNATLYQPTNGTFKDKERDINFTVYDSSGIGFLNVSIIVNNSVNLSIWAANNVLTTRKINFTDGAHNVVINVTDNVTNTNQSVQYNFTIDNTAPATLTFVSPTPSNRTVYNVSLINWTFVNLTFTETNPSNCTLEWRNATGWTNRSMSIINSSYCTTNVTGQGPSEARYVVIVNDTANNTVRSVLRTVAFDVNGTIPTVTLDLPVEGYNSSTQTLNLSWSVGDRWSTQHTNCTVTANDVVLYTATNLLNNTIYNFTTASYADNATVNWTVSCFDGIGDKSTAIGKRNITIDASAPSSIEFNSPSPVNGFNTTGTTRVFNWTVTDSFTNTLNCSLGINGVTNVTVASASRVATSFNVSAVFAENSYAWNVSCSDKSGLGISSSNRTFRVDTTAPRVVLDKSLNISSSNHRLAWFNLTLNDTGSQPSSCYARFKYDDGSYGGNTSGTMTVVGEERRCNLTIGATDVTRQGRIIFQLFSADNAGNIGNATGLTEVNASNWTVIFLRSNSWNLISVDRNSTYNATSNLTGGITSVSKFNNTGKSYKTFVVGIESNTFQNLTDGEAVYVYNNATQNITIMRKWEVHRAQGVVQTSNFTQMVSQGWNQIATYNNSLMTVSGICNLPNALSNALDNGTITYASFYASNESKYLSFRCGFTYNSDVRVPKGTGVWINLNGSVTGFNQTFTIWRDS